MVASPPSSRIMFGRPPSAHSENLAGIFPIVLEALALDGEDRRAAGGNCGGGMILRRIDVAGTPAHIGAERFQRLDQHRGLNGHVQRAGDARAFERLLRPIFLARRHQARHFGLGDGDFLAAPIGEADVLDHVIGGRKGFGGGARAHDDPSGSFAFWKLCLLEALPSGGLARNSGLPIAGRRGYGNKDIKIPLCPWFRAPIGALMPPTGGGSFGAGLGFGDKADQSAFAGSAVAAAGRGLARTTPAWVRALAICCMRLMSSTAAAGGRTRRAAG